MWLLPVVLLLAAGSAITFVLRGAGGIFGWVVGALVVTSLLWVMISVLWPPTADRTCPTCGAEAVRRLDPSTTQGLLCGACGWRDETASSWLLAEEEGPLEDVVLRSRGRSGTGDDPRDRESIAPAGSPRGQSPEDELEGRHG